MKMPKEKHKHKLTHILKFAIFSIIMLAPFFAIISKMIYVACNKNAKDSYYGETINEEITTPIARNNFTIGQEYIFYNTNNINQSIVITGPSNANYFTYKNAEMIDGGTLSQTQRDLIISGVKMGFYKPNTEQTYTSIFIYQSNNNNVSFSSTINFSFKFTLMGFASSENGMFELYNETPITQQTYNKYSYLDNAFYYAVNQIKEDNLFSWTKNSSLYGAINTMNTGLGLTNDHVLSYLLTYWALMTAIYIIFDIVIFAFEKMTHFYE